STPVLWKHGNEQALVVLGGGHLISYDLKAGRKRWWFDDLPTVFGAALTPVYAEDTFFIAVAVGRAGDPVNPIELPDFNELIEMYDSDKDNRLIQAEIPEDMALIYRRGPQFSGVKRRFAQLDTDKDGAINEAEWSKAVVDVKEVPPSQTDALIAIRGGGRDDVSHSHVQWRVSEGIGQVASPLFYQGRVYLVKHGGNITCYDAKTGDKLFGNRIGPRVYYFASPVAADDKIYFCSLNGVMIVLQAGDTFDALAQNKIRGRIYATPALVDGKIYLRTDKHMYAFGQAKQDVGRAPLEIAELPKKEPVKERPSTQVEHAQVKTLHEAASDGDIELIRSLVSSGADVNEQNNWGWTPLYTAVATGHGDIVRLLIAEGADADTPSKAGLTPLHFAVNNGNRDIAKLLIKNGADCRTADENGATPLHASAERGHIDIARLLVDNNADIDAKDKWVWTPLFYSCWKNHKDLAEFLITKGADINIKDSRGMTLLHIAGQQDIIELLIAKGIDVNSKNNSGQTPLHSALQRGNKELTELFINTGADINIKNNYGQTPLNLAARDGLKHIVERLLAKGADVKAQNDNGRTSIGLAKENGHTEIVELLLEHANQSGDSKEIMTFYDYAAVGDIEQIKSLVSQGMDVNAKTEAGTIALHFAVRNGHRDIAEYFISQGADTDTKNNYGYTPLLLATGHKDIAELLIAKGANINTKNNSGQTPMHLAARNGQKDVIELLIAKGADVNAKDRWKWTPLKWADYGGHGEVSELLRKHGAEE
ncbi:MAG: ankyrin repeat domain-containing protein, partial [Phycisphaerales bacterium]